MFKASFKFFILMTLISVTSFADITLRSTDLESALNEYLSQTDEASSLLAPLHDGQSIYIMGSGATTLAFAVEEHLKNPTKKLLPKSFLDLFHENQDLDLVIDSSFEELKAYRERLGQTAFGIREGHRIDLLTLMTDGPRGILDNSDWHTQNTDLISTGLIKITTTMSATKHPNLMNTRTYTTADGQEYGFSHVIKSRVNRYLDNENHYEAFLAKVGKNPKVVSALKTISNNLRFNLEITNSDLTLLTAIIKGFTSKLEDGSLVLGRGEWIPKNEEYVFSRLHMTASKALSWNEQLSLKAIKIFDQTGVTRLMEVLESKRDSLRGFMTKREETLSKKTCISILN